MLTIDGFSVLPMVLLRLFVKLNQNLGIYYSDNENHNQTRLVHTYVYGYILVVHMVQNPLEFRANGERD